MEFEKIKLIIWDLDETLWKGVLSDGTAEILNDNIELVKNAVDSGVVCSICSKNDEDAVWNFMSSTGVADLFVFSSINWSPKGDRVRQIIEEMALRPVNVLFIDDNETNLAEVGASCDGIMLANIDVLPSLQEYFKNHKKTDNEHKRLNQYKVLEKKAEFKAIVGSNERFLSECNIRVSIKNDCENHLDRIEDLILRSNQLNFTKVRSSIDELKALISEKDVECGYVEVVDNFGDYGIVGFYALKDNTLIHFTFSCRTLNMGVEQYVYHMLKKPQITIVGDVSSELQAELPYWINSDNCTKQTDNSSKANVKKCRLLLKGPCDISQMFSYIQDTDNIKTEFSYVSDKGVQIHALNHTEHIIESQMLSQTDKNELLSLIPFGDKGMFETQIYDADLDFVMLSMFCDSHMGVYKEKKTGRKVAFGEFTNDLTDENKWPRYLSKELYVGNYCFSIEELENFKRNFEYTGRLTVNGIIENLHWIQQHLGSNTKLILCLGSETAYQGQQHEVNHYIPQFNKELNQKIRKWAEVDSRLFYIDVNDYISGQQDFTNSVTHFSKRVYYEMSKALISIISQNSDMQLKNYGRFKRDVRLTISAIKEKLGQIL